MRLFLRNCGVASITVVIHRLRSSLPAAWTSCWNELKWRSMPLDEHTLVL